MIEASTRDFASQEAVIVMLAVISVLFLLVTTLLGVLLRGFMKSLEDFKNAVSSMEKAIISLEGKAENTKSKCDAHSINVDGRLKTHGERLDKHELKITVLEERIKPHYKYTKITSDEEENTHS